MRSFRANSRAGVLLWIVALATAAGVGCARTDLGAPCHLLDATGGEIRPQPGRDYVYLGSSECESFACLATPGAPGAYCSQPCSGAGASCPAGLTCSALSLDQEYLDAMKQRLPPKEYETLFGQLTSTFYCVRK